VRYRNRLAIGHISKSVNAIWYHSSGYVTIYAFEIRMHKPVSGHILIVDDSEYNRLLLERQLTRRGHTVLTAGSGLQGLTYAR